MSPLVTRLPGDPEPGSPEWLLLEVRWCAVRDRLAKLERLAEQLPGAIAQARFDYRDLTARLGRLPGQDAHPRPARNGRNLAPGETGRIILAALAEGPLTLGELGQRTGLAEGQIHGTMMGLRSGDCPQVLKAHGRGTPYRLNPDRQDGV